MKNTKKAKFGKLDFEKIEVLSRNELKKVNGGGYYVCPNGPNAGKYVGDLRECGCTNFYWGCV